MNNTNTLEVIQTFGNKIDNYIQIAAEKGNQTVEHFWPIIVRQQSIEGWTFVIGFSLIILICTIFLVRAIGNFEDKSGNFTARGVFGIIAGFILVFSCIFIFISITEETNVIGKILNPEYAALKQVIKMIK